MEIPDDPAPVVPIQQLSADIDLNQDGKVDSDERQIILNRWKLKERTVKQSVAFVPIACIVVAALGCFPAINLDKFKVVEDMLISCCYGCFSVVGAFMGISAWYSKPK